MYKQYFHFSELPFSISPDPHFIYMSARHQEGLAHLLYGMDFGGGFVALTGEVGTGKTTLCHCLLQQLPKNIDVALILNSKLNVLELLATICDELGIVYNQSQLSLKPLIDLLNHYLLTAHANGRRTVLLIDEAQNLSLEVLEQIRLLTNLETSKTKLLRIVLVGQPELKDLLKRQDLRQLNQRITARYHLQSLDLEETRSYIHHRLLVSNGQQDIFKETAIRKIYKLSSGIPRLINILCDRALLGAYSTNTTVVTPTIVSAAAKEVLVGDNKKTVHLGVFLSLLLLVGMVTSIYFINYRPKIIKQTLLSSTVKAVEQFAIPKVEKSTPSIEKIQSLPIAKAPSFSEWINNPSYTLDAALINALKNWGKTIPNNGKIDCHTLETTGLHCVLGQANWKDILALNHPIILEFTLTDNKKHHALVTGFGQNQTMIQFTNKISYPVADVLKYWDGYYLALTAPPEPVVREIKSHQASNDVLWLRYVLNTFDQKNATVNKPRVYDDELSLRIKNFQHHYHLTEDGKVGAKTLEQLKALARTFDFFHLEITP